MRRLSPAALSIIILFCCSFVFGQAPGTSKSKHDAGSRTLDLSRMNRIPDDDVEIPERAFPGRGGKVDWGLALSGGGVRSGAFSIGIMKALYETGLMDDIDVISSVSGGGYGAYWLYRSYDRDPKLKFGEGVFDDKVFVRDLCELEQKSDFYSIGNIFLNFFRSRNGAFNSYESSIRRTFSSGSREKVEIGRLNGDISAARVPFFILNTSVGGKETEPLRNVLELIPTYVGNEKFLYYSWINEYDQISHHSESAATSAAAIRFKLSRRIPDQSDPAKILDLADGGLLENTGALALIRRGVKNVIIVDAENDPAYKFEAYNKLKSWLYDRYDIELNIKEIEDFLSSRNKIFSTAAVAKGYARTKTGSKKWKINVDSAVYYIKMSRPGVIFNNINEQSPQYKKGEAFIKRRDQVFKSGGRSCAALTGMTFDEDMFVYRVRRYSHFLNDEWLLRGVVKITPWLNYNFPQTTTLDQTFDKRQFEAFVGLGYLQAKGVRDRTNDIVH